MIAAANVERVRSIYAAWERGDFSESRWAHPQIELVIADGPSPGRWTGLVGMAQGRREFLSTCEDLRVELEEYRELDAKRVLVFGRNRGRGKASGLELGHMQTWGANVHHVRGGKVTKHVLYYDRERALADLGLAPRASSP